MKKKILIKVLQMCGYYCENVNFWVYLKIIKKQYFNLILFDCFYVCSLVILLRNRAAAFFMWFNKTKHMYNFTTLIFICDKETIL